MMQGRCLRAQKARAQVQFRLLRKVSFDHAAGRAHRATVRLERSRIIPTPL